MSRTTSRSDQLATTTAHAAQLQTRLLVALDTLDSQSLAHASELNTLQASYERLEARARRLEYERNTANHDLAEMTSVLEVVIEKVSAANDYKVLAHSNLHIPSPLSPTRRAHSSRNSPQTDTTTDPSAYTAALVSALTAQLDAARAQGARERAESERKIARLEAMVELRDVELKRNLSRSLNAIPESPRPSGSGSGSVEAAASGSGGESTAWRSSGMSRGEAISAYERIAKDNERLEKEVTRLRTEMAASDFNRATSEIGPSSSWSQLPDWARPQPQPQASSGPEPSAKESKAFSSKRREAEPSRAQSTSSERPPSSVSASFSDNRPSGSSTPDSYRALPSALQSNRVEPSILDSTRAGPSMQDSTRADPSAIDSTRAGPSIVDSSRAVPSSVDSSQAAASTLISRPRTGTSTLDPHRTRTSILTADSHRPRSAASGSTADTQRPRSSADTQRPRSSASTSTADPQRPRSSASTSARASRRSLVLPFSESESERDTVRRNAYVPTRRSGLRDSGIGADSGTDRASGTGRVRERERVARRETVDGTEHRHGRRQTQAQHEQQQSPQEQSRQQEEEEESTATRAQNLMPLVPALTPSKVRAPRVEVVELPSTTFIEPSFGVDMRGGRERRGSGTGRRRGEERRAERVRGEERREIHAERRGSGSDRREDREDREAGTERGDTGRLGALEPLRIGDLEPIRLGTLEPLRMNILEPPRSAMLGPAPSPGAISPVGELLLPPSVVSRTEAPTQPDLVPADLVQLMSPSPIQSPSLASVEPAQTTVSPPSTLQSPLVPALQAPLIPTLQPARALQPSLPLLEPSPMLHTVFQNIQPQRSRSSSRTARHSPLPVFDLTGLPAYEAVPSSSVQPDKDLLGPIEGSPARRQSDPAPTTQPNSPLPLRPRANSVAPSTPPRSTNNTAQFAFITPVHVDTYGKENGEGAGDGVAGMGNLLSVEAVGDMMPGDASALSATGTLQNPGNTSTNTTGRRRLLPMFKFISPAPGTPPSSKKRRSNTAPSQFRTSTNGSGSRGGAGPASPMGIAASPLARGRPVRESPLQLVLGSAHAARRAEMRVPVMREVGGASAGTTGVGALGPTGLVPLVPFAPLVPLVAPLVPTLTQPNPVRPLTAPPASSVETVLRGMEAEQALLSRAQVGGEVTAEGMARVLLIEAECLRLRRNTAEADALRQEVALLRTRLQEQASAGADSMMEQDYTTTTSMTSHASESAQTYSDAGADSILTATDDVDPARRRLRDVEQGLRDARAELDAKERAVAELKMRLGDV
ncbi:hypothetical protein BDV93DRAFT_549386 [Ceratobasidium sp. AG-I]|nr:hypothetical protein BDV93DRAFT_549386 [Ceratobasidium sp. AG-I]